MLHKSLIFMLLFGVSIVGSTVTTLAVGVGQTCGGLAGIPCDGTLWCDPDPGQCGGHDIAGKCVEIKTAGCTFEFAPVCGCNNETYGNDCGRLKAKEPKKSQGECKKEDK